MALDLCKYYKKQRFVSYDNGQTWQPLDEYERGELYEAHSSSCGAGIFQYRWVLVDGSYICDGKDRYTREVYQYSEDGTVWYNVFPTQYRKATLVERNSPFCDNAGNGQYIDEDPEPDSGGTNCPPDYHWNGVECVCDGHQVGDDCIICKGGQQWNGSGCACPAGMNWDSIGKRCYSPSFWTPCDPLKIIKCSNSNGVLTQLDTSYYGSGWAIVNYEVGDCIYRLNDNAFNGQKYMTAITIPSSVIEVGKWVFANCESLLKISFPTSALTELGEYTFNNCSNLTAVTFGGTIPSVLPNSLFANCINLQTTSWLQYSNVTSISEKAFYNCYSLNGVTLPQTLQTIGNQAFYCNYTLENIVIPSGVTSIGSSAFTNCSGLTFVNINSNDVSIGNSVFQGCTNLTAATFESSAVTMGNNVFSGCARLLKLTFNSPTPFEIGEHDFDNTNECAIFVPCQSEQAYKTAWSQYADRIRCNDTGVYYRWVDDPSGIYCDGYDQYTRQKQQSTTNGITWTDTGVYRPIDFITHYSEVCGYEGEVVLKVTNEDGFTRYYEPCNVQYRTISGTPYCGGSTMHDKYVDVYYQESGDEGESWITTATTTVLVESESQDCVQYRWVDSGTTCVSGNLWEQQIKQESIDEGLTWNNVIPETYSATTLIENNSLECCKLVYILSDSSVNNLECDSSTTLEKNSVYRGATSAIIGNCVTSIGNGAFQDCNNITSIGIPSGVTSIGGAAFQGCYVLTSIEIPSGVTSIGGSAFAYCRGLKRFNSNNDGVFIIPNSITSINDSVFWECINLSTCIISSGITSIGNSAFRKCTGMTSIIIPDSVTSIGDYTFHQCSGLTSIIIPDSVTTIGDYVLNNCSNLTNISIGSGITSIGREAFSYSNSLSSITIKATIPPALVGSRVFDNTNNCIIYVPSESVETYKSSWYFIDNSRIQAIP